jgi:Uma2 family endonuclease
MSVGTRPLTAEELLAMPDDGMQHELVRGELITRAAAGGLPGWITMRLATHLQNHVDGHQLGATFSSDTGFLLSRNPDTVRQPDASFVSDKRAVEIAGVIPNAPDLAVEVISPSDLFSEIDAKVLEYLGAGTGMVIVINPVTRSATVHTPTAVSRLTINDTIDGGDVVPGWTLPLREIFE